MHPQDTTPTAHATHGAIPSNPYSSAERYALTVTLNPMHTLHQLLMDAWLAGYRHGALDLPRIEQAAALLRGIPTPPIGSPAPIPSPQFPSQSTPPGPPLNPLMASLKKMPGWRDLIHAFGPDACGGAAFWLVRPVSRYKPANLKVLRLLSTGNPPSPTDEPRCGTCGTFVNPYSLEHIDWNPHFISISKDPDAPESVRARFQPESPLAPSPAPTFDLPRRTFEQPAEVEPNYGTIDEFLTGDTSPTVETLDGRTFPAPTGLDRDIPQAPPGLANRPLAPIQEQTPEDRAPRAPGLFDQLVGVMDALREVRRELDENPNQGVPSEDAIALAIQAATDAGAEGGTPDGREALPEVQQDAHGEV